MKGEQAIRCASCGRVEGNGADQVRAVTVEGVKWCPSCAAIKKLPNGKSYVVIPSPGRMYEGTGEDALAAWEDCYEKKPKRRILVKKAKVEIQRAWSLWNGDKSSASAMIVFFGWLSRNRPYFLTFRGKGDPWQTVHSWLLQYEAKKRNAKKGANKAVKPLAELARTLSTPRLLAHGFAIFARSVAPS